MAKIFIDGQAGTTGLQINARLRNRTELTILEAPETGHRDPAVRKALLNEADVAILCLPDDAAREAVALIDNPDTRVLDASTAHRIAPGWAYGLPELGPAFRTAVARGNRVANPGCHATGFITLVRPLVQAGIVPPDYPLTAHSVTGYTGGGKKMIADYEGVGRSPELDSPRQYGLTLHHKHLPEMAALCGLPHPPIFNPIAADFPRGMVVTVPLYLSRLNGPQTLESLRKAYCDCYAGEKFIHVMPGGIESGFLAANTIVGTNDLEIFVLGNEEQAIVISRFDNLGKGASGAAVQNLNLMLGLPEDTGL